MVYLLKNIPSSRKQFTPRNLHVQIYIAFLQDFLMANSVIMSSYESVFVVFASIQSNESEITEPCGTPAFVEKDSDDIPSTTTLIRRLVRELSISICEVLVWSQRLAVWQEDFCAKLGQKLLRHLGLHSEGFFPGLLEFCSSCE